MTDANNNNRHLDFQANQVFTVEQIANYLQLAEITILRYIRLGKIKAVKIGKAYRITSESLTNFLEGNAHVK